MSSQQKSSFTVFSEIDALVSKPVIGSDGAASWQAFQIQSISSSDDHDTGAKRSKDNKAISTLSRGVAPHLPTKRADRLGSGFNSIVDERAHEAKVREEAGDATLGSGYTVFKRKKGEEEAERAEEKRNKMIMERVRPEEAKYFIKADTFEGWKEDYVFTTKEGRGTGYYWDGMDSAKKLISTDGNLEGGWNAGESHIKTRKKKKKKKDKKSKKKADSSDNTNTTTIATPLDIHQTHYNDPMEQVQNALRRRNEILSKRPTLQGLNPTTATEIQMEHERTEMNALTGTILFSITPTSTDNLPSSLSTSSDAIIPAELASCGWEVATDPASKKAYYFNRSTGERRWDCPPLPGSDDGDRCGDVDLSSNNSKSKSTSHSTLDAAPLKLTNGWSEVKDPKTGRNYYYHAASGKTSWDRPT